MKIKKMIRCSLFASIMCISSIIMIPLPFTPIPITLQLAAALVAGAVLGPIGGAVSMVIYLLLGVAGLPVFAGLTGGVGRIAGPTGGFIIGFIPCAFVTGFIYSLAKKLHIGKSGVKGLFISMIAGTLILYIFGTVHFTFVTGTPIAGSVAVTVLPFFWADLLKVFVAVLISKKLIFAFIPAAT